MSRFVAVPLNLRRHPKAARLCRRLQNPLAWAYVVDMWAWAMEYAPDGDLTKFGAEVIEEALGWTLDAGVLYAALRECGWIDDTEDGSTVIHDWEEHQGKWLAKMEANKKRLRKFRKAHGNPLVNETRTKRVRTASVRDNTTQHNKTEQNITKQDQSPESSEPLRAQEPVAFVFPVVGGADFWELRKSEHEGLAKAFPGVDLPAQYEKALVWLKANPGRRKTPRGMPQFLFGWMERVQNRMGTPANGTRNGTGPPTPSKNVQVLGNWLEAKGGGQ